MVHDSEVTLLIWLVVLLVVSQFAPIFVPDRRSRHSSAPLPTPTVARPDPPSRTQGVPVVSDETNPANRVSLIL